eukprot:2915103-Pyramimonas_sp.AAC.1
MRVQRLRSLAVLKFQEWRSGTNSGSSKRNSQVAPCRWSPKNNVVACFRVPNGCLPTRQFPQWK